MSALDAKRLEALNKLNERKENLYQEAITLTADSEKFSASLEQIENHQKQLEQELADKGIDGRETMEYLLEKVTNRSNMPVLFIILMMGCIGGAAGFIMGNYQMMDLKQFWVKPGICLGAAFVFLYLQSLSMDLIRRSVRRRLFLLWLRSWYFCFWQLYCLQ